MVAARQVDPELKKKGGLTASQAGGATVLDFFEAHKDSIKKVLPKHLDPDRMLSIALKALNQTPKLKQCTLNSLFGALVTCSQLGLEPNTPQSLIYLIPFENRKKETTEVQVIIGYKGLIDLARRSGEIVSISSHAVFENDEFEVSFGTDESIVHRPKLKGDRGIIVGFYAVAKLAGGGTQFEFMSASDVNKIRDGSQGYKTALRYDKKDTPWIANYEAMGRKSAIRRLCNYLPMSVELATATALEGRAERNEGQDLENVLDGSFSVMADDAPPLDYDPATGEVIEGDTGGQETTGDDTPPPQQVEHKPAVVVDNSRQNAAQPASDNPGQQRQQDAPQQQRRGLLDEDE